MRATLITIAVILLIVLYYFVRDVVNVLRLREDIKHGYRGMLCSYKLNGNRVYIKVLSFDKDNNAVYAQTESGKRVFVSLNNILL